MKYLWGKIIIDQNLIKNKCKCCIFYCNKLVNVAISMVFRLFQIVLNVLDDLSVIQLLFS